MTTREKILEYFSGAILWCLMYFSPVLPAILTVGLFVICDMITGIVASQKTGDEIQSRKLKRTVYKFIAYGIAVLVAYVIERQFLNDFPAMKLIAGFIAYIELKSLNENIEIITGVNLFKTVLEKLSPPQPSKKYGKNTKE